MPQLHAERARADTEWSADCSEERTTPRHATNGAVAVTTIAAAAVAAAAAADTSDASTAGMVVVAASGCPSRQETVTSEEAFRLLRKASKKTAQVTIKKTPPGEKHGSPRHRRK